PFFRAVAKPRDNVSFVAHRARHEGVGSDPGGHCDLVVGVEGVVRGIVDNDELTAREMRDRLGACSPACSLGGRRATATRCGVAMARSGASARAGARRSAGAAPALGTKIEDCDAAL